MRDMHIARSDILVYIRYYSNDILLFESGIYMNLVATNIIHCQITVNHVLSAVRIFPCSLRLRLLFFVNRVVSRSLSCPQISLAKKL